MSQINLEKIYRTLSTDPKRGSNQGVVRARFLDMPSVHA